MTAAAAAVVAAVPLEGQRVYEEMIASQGYLLRPVVQRVDMVQVHNI